MKRDRFELFMEHLNGLASVLRERGIRPGIWCDMMLTGKLSDAQIDAQVNKFPKYLTAWYWDYYYGSEEKNLSYWAGRIDHLTENGFSVIFAPATASWGDSPFLPMYGKHSDNVAAAAELARRKNLHGLCITSWSVHLSPKRLQYPLWELAAQRYLAPGVSVEKDFSAILVRRLGTDDIQMMKDITSWFPSLIPFDSRFGTCAAKWARPIAGTAKDGIERYRREEPDYVPPLPHEIEANFASVRRALSKMEAKSSDSRTAPFISGAKLAISHAETIADELGGKVPVRFPEEETRRFFGIEQSASSAAVSSSLVWMPLAGEGGMHTETAAANPKGH